MDARNSKRVKADDPTAIAEMGKRCRDAGDYEEAVKYFTKAAELGDVNAHHELAAFYDTGVIYRNRGEGIKKDHKKFMYHLEEACIGGHALARCDLGYVEEIKGNRERSAKHYIIAAKQGDPPALNVVKTYFTSGAVSKEDYDSTLREHQAALDAAKSTQREEAYAYFARVAERRAFFNR
jgi:TPR repeat protein